MVLIIAEKPSVGKSIAKVVGADKGADGYVSGNGYIVSWCVGHLVELAPPSAYDPALEKWSLDTLPILPAEYKTEVVAATQKQFDILATLMRRDDVSELVEATDAGREGELIFRLVYHQAGCNKPFSRLWISSMEDKAILEGMSKLKPSTDYDTLYQAALCRQRADWLMGINLTRLYTKLYNKRLPCGRVQTPTINLIVQRHNEIESFVPQEYFTLVADLDGFKAYSRAETRAKAEQMKKRGSGIDAFVTAVVSEERQETPPKLYDLTTLQREANRQFGYSAQETLDYMQRLYEAKLATYPRTDSRYLTSEMLDSTQALLGYLLSTGILPESLVDTYNTALVKIPIVINDKKVSDHHAIIPTQNLTKANYDALPTGEKNIMSLLVCRLLAAPYAPHVYNATKITFDLAGDPYTSTGRIDLERGYCIIQDAIFPSADPGNPTDDEPDNALMPTLQEGDTRPVLSVKAEAKKTRPPKPYTDDTLLGAMETCGKALANDDLREAMKDHGLGTPATRAGILESIIKNGYVKREKKSLIPTATALLFMELVTDKLKDPIMTAEWEKQLSEIQRGDADPDAFMGNIVSFLSSFISDSKLICTPDESSPFKSERESIGTCPICGKNVVEYPKSYSCESGRDGCGFTIWKTIAKKSISKTQAQKLLTNGRTDLIEGFTSKAGKSFDAHLVVKEDYSVGFAFPDKKKE